MLSMICQVVLLVLFLVVFQLRCVVFCNVVLVSFAGSLLLQLLVHNGSRCDVIAVDAALDSRRLHCAEKERLIVPLSITSTVLPKNSSEELLCCHIVSHDQQIVDIGHE
eukprot:943751-Amphidinium_carterae.2